MHVHLDLDACDRSEVAIAEGVLVPARLVADLTDLGIAGVASIRIEIESEGGRLRCTSIAFTAAAGEEVRADVFRDLSLGDLVGETMFGVTLVQVDTPDWVASPASIFIEARAGNEEVQRRARAALHLMSRRRRVTDDLLREVAEVYRAADDGRPTEAVARRFAASHSTAARWVGLARERDFLGATSSGRKGEQSRSPAKRKRS